MNPEPQPTSPSARVEHAQKRPRLVAWLIGLPVALFALLMLISEVVFYFSPDREQQWVDRETIRMCWKEQQRAPDSDKPRHFTGGATQCQDLERTFKERWGINPS